MTILTLPSIRGASTVQWGLIGYTQAQVSPFDETTQTIAMPGARFAGSVAYNNLSLADWRALTAFLAQLGGRSGRFYFTPPQSWRRASGTLGTPVIDGAGQTGSSLAVRGVAASSQILLPGDYLSFPDPSGRPELHIVTGTVTADGSGDALIPLAPPLRKAGNDGAAVELTSPVGVFMLTDDKQGQSAHSGDKPMRASVSFDIIEALV